MHRSMNLRSMSTGFLVPWVHLCSDNSSSLYLRFRAIGHYKELLVFYLLSEIGRKCIEKLEFVCWLCYLYWLWSLNLLADFIDASRLVKFIVVTIAISDTLPYFHFDVCLITQKIDWSVLYEKCKHKRSSTTKCPSLLTWSKLGRCPWSDQWMILKY